MRQFVYKKHKTVDDKQGQSGQTTNSGSAGGVPQSGQLPFAAPKTSVSQVTPVVGSLDITRPNRPSTPVTPSAGPVVPTSAPSEPVPPAPPPPNGRPWWKIFGGRNRLRLLAIIVLVLLALGSVAVLFTVRQNQDNNSSLLKEDITSRYNTLELPLDELVQKGALTTGRGQILTINGQLRANNTLVLAPTPQPSNAVAGQMYFDQGTNQLAYFNGSEFVPVAGDEGVTSLGGASGTIVVGAGLALVGGTVSNSGVLTVQGQSGAVSFTAGDGIAVNGTVITNSGVTSLGGQTGIIAVGSGLAMGATGLRNAGVVTLTPGTPNLQVTNDGSGNLTISSVGGGSATVSSGGGTAGRIAKFTAAQNIEDSILSESAGTVTAAGNLSATGSLSLGSALTVVNGGTGAASLAANGVLVGNGTSPVGSVTAGGAGLCLMSTAGAPSFQACPGGGGVTSLNGQTGAVSVANATASGGIVTINDASTSQKGIAQFNSTNFSASGGVINTIQDIAVSAAPTFGRLSLTSSQATNPMLLVNNTNVGASGNLLDLQLNGVSQLAVTPSGNLTLTGTVNGQTISSAASLTGTLAVAGQANLNGGASVTGTLSANTITPSASLTVGATNQSFLLQGNSSSTITATSGVNTTTLSFQAPTANVTYRLLTAAAGTYDICTTVGNCSGVGGGVTTPGGTTNRIAKFSASQTIADSIITDDGSTVTVGGTLAVNTITPSAAMTVGATSQNLTLQGAAGTTLTATSGVNTTTLSFQAPTANVTYRLPTAAAGTYDLCTTVGNCAGVGGGVTTSGGTINRLAKFTGSQTLGDSILTDNGTSVSVSGNMNLTTGNQYQINGTQISSANLSNDANLAKLDANQTFTGVNLFKNSVNSTTALQVQPSGSTTPVFNVDTTNSRIGIGNAAPTVDLDVGPASLGLGQVIQTRVGDLVLQSQQGSASGITASNTRGSNGNLTLDGASGSSLYLSPFTTNNNFLAAGGGNVRVGDQTAPTYKLDVAGDVNISTGSVYRVNGTQISSANLSNDANLAKLNATQTFTGATNTFQNSSDSTNAFAVQNAAGRNVLQVNTTGAIVTLGNVTAGVGAGLAGALRFADGTNDNFALTLNTTTLTADRTVSLPDEAGTICLQNSVNCGFALSSGSGNYIQNQSASDQTASFRISGTGQANTSILTPLLDTASAVALNVGTTNATSINLNKATNITGALVQSASAATSLSGTGGGGSIAITTTNAALTLTAGTTSTWSTSNGNLTVQAATTNSLILQTGGAGTVQLGNNNTTTIDIGRGSNIVRTIRIGDAGTSQAQTITIGSTGGASALNLQGGTGNMNFTTSGTGSKFFFRSSTDSTTAFQIKNNLQLNTVFNADTSNARVGINMDNPSYTLDVFGDANIGLLSSYRVGGTAVCNIGGCTPASGSSNYIQNGTGAQSSNFYVQAASSGSVAGTLRANAAGSGDILNLINGAGTTVGSVGSTGSTLFKTSTNSTTGFQVQNTSGVNQLSVDTTNSRVYVGPTAGDTTGTIVVLGNKTSYTGGANSGDPTGVAGAMYYNSSLGQFRCYEVDHWRDCLESVRTQYHYSNDMIGRAADNVIATEGTTGTGGTNFDTIDGETKHPGILILQTLTSATGFAALVPRTNGTQILRLGNNDYWKFESVQRISTAGGGLSTSGERYTYRAGFLEDATAGDGANGCFFRYSDNVNTGKWQGVCRDASTESTCDAAITVAVDTWYRLTVAVNAAGSSVDFLIDGVSKCQITTNIPTASNKQTNWGIGMIKSVGTTNRYVDVDYLDVLGEFGSSR